jgi:hypothetical protein
MTYWSTNIRDKRAGAGQPNQHTHAQAHETVIQSSVTLPQYDVSLFTTRLDLEASPGLAGEAGLFLALDRATIG